MRRSRRKVSKLVDPRSAAVAKMKEEGKSKDYIASYLKGWDNVKGKL